MSYKIVVDSCCELTETLRAYQNIQAVPLTLQIGDYKIADDENYDQNDFVTRMLAYEGTAKSACPSPGAFAEAYAGDADDIYVVTITKKLSGTYNSALQGIDLYREDGNAAKNIHVFDSEGTSGMEVLIVEKIHELAETGKPFNEVVDGVNDFIKNHLGLYFCLDNLENLRKNGRLSNLAAAVLKRLNVKLICKAVDGDIEKVSQDFTISRAILKMCNIMREELAAGTAPKKLIVTHCRCQERADLVAAKLSENLQFEKVETLKMSGLNSLYANDGGIIVSFCH